MKQHPAESIPEAKSTARRNSNGQRNWNLDQFRIAFGEEDPAGNDAFDAVPLDLEESRLTPFVDLVALWKSGVKPEKPTVVRVSETRCLFYAGRLNEMHSEPSLGKTNIAIYSALKVLEAGGSVLYMDPEDTASGFLSRLLALGLANMPLLIEQMLGAGLLHSRS